MVLVGQVNSDVVSLLNAHGPFAVGLSGEDAQLFTAERRDAVVDGEPVDLGQVGEVVDVQPQIVHALLDEAQGAGRRDRRPRPRRRSSTTSTPTPPPPRSPSPSAPRSSSCSPTSRGCTPTGRARRPPRAARGHQRDRRRRARRAAAVAVQRHGPEDGGLPAGRAGRRPARARPRRTGGRTACCSSCSPTRASGPWWSLARLSDLAAALGRRDDGQLRDAGRRAGARRGRARLGRRRPRVPRPRRRHRRQRPRSRAPRRGRGGHLAGRSSSATPATSRCTSRASGSPSGSGTLVGAGPDTRVLFTNSGAEANEAALKISRRLRPGGGWVACEGAFHGRTLGALAITGQPAKRAPFEPLPGPVTLRAVRRRGCPRGGRRRHHRLGGARAGDGRGRRGRRRPTASSRRHAPRATAPARCSTSTRSKAGSAGSARG